MGRPHVSPMRATHPPHRKPLNPLRRSPRTSTLRLSLPPNPAQALQRLTGGAPMIRPRPTTYFQAVRENDYAVLSQGTLRPLAHCDICNARLSRYRYPGETRCAPCPERHRRSLTLDELHPQVRIPDHGMVSCPGCGGLKDRKARQCHSCRHGRSEGSE